MCSRGTFPFTFSLDFGFCILLIGIEFIVLQVLLDIEIEMRLKTSFYYHKVCMLQELDTFTGR